MEEQERIKQLEEELELSKKDADVKSKQVRNLQASKDRANARINQMLAERQSQAARPASIQQQVAAQQQQQQQSTPPLDSTDLESFRDEQNLETYKLRALMNAGLTEEDLDPDLEFSTPGELNAHVRIIQLEKKLADQGRQVETVGGELPEPEASPTRIDLGGPSDNVPGSSSSTPKTGSEKAAGLRQEARELKERGDPESLLKARLLILEASHIDPASILGKGKGGKTPD